MTMACDGAAVTGGPPAGGVARGKLTAGKLERSNRRLEARVEKYRDTTR